MKPRPGIALLLALVVLLFIEVMTAGLLALTTQSRLVVASQMRTVRADAAAELAVREVLSAWEVGRFDTVPDGALLTVVTGNDGDASWSATIERLRATYVIRGAAWVGASSAFSTGRAAAVVRTLDSRAVLEQLNAALLTAGSTVIAGASRVRAGPAMPSGWADSLCPAVDPLPSPDALRSATVPTVAETAVVEGAFVYDTSLVLSDSVALGGAKWSELEQIADRIESGSVTPLPVHDEVSCAFAAPSNWGDPSAPERPCSDYFPFIYSPGDLEMAGGAGQGILAVGGTLTVRGGALFVGVVLAREGVIIEPGATIRGTVRSVGVALIEDADLSYSRCAIARALSRSAATRRLILHHRTFVPAF